MKKLSIPAWRGEHYVSLGELLQLLREVVSEYSWHLNVDEASPGPRQIDLHALRADTWLKTTDLLNLVSPDAQIIDGEAVGFSQPTDTVPTIVLRAVDSTSWDLESDDPSVIARVSAAFPDREEILD
jgi:predicted secreted protein